MGISFLISLNNSLFKNIPHVGSFCYLVIWCICVFVYLCICVFVFSYLHVWLMGISFLIPLNNSCLKNIPHVGSFWHLLILCICVFVYLCICIFLFACLTRGNIIFDSLEQSCFQKYTICWVFMALCHMLYVCICVFVYLYLCICVWHTW